ncbi:MAG: hypothetical protein QG596_1972 [Actinomycetota bacterium]|nr:hypothetical protein [Actinomycetota bacterium]
MILPLIARNLDSILTRVSRQTADRWLPWFLVGGLILIGFALRFVEFNLSSYGDEMSTLWIVSGNDFSTVVDLVDSDAEISPPFFFLMAKVFTVFGENISSIRLPSMVAGVAVIPVYYLVALRTLGRRAAYYSTAIAAVSPFLVYFSANARGYSVMILMVMLAALALTFTVSENGRWWHWLAFSVAAALAVYSHYVGALAIAGEVLWVLVCFPAARVKVIAWSLLAALLFAPWLGGFRADMDSPTSEILQALQQSGIRAKLEAIWQLLFLRPTQGSSPLFWSRPDLLLGIVALVVASAGVAARFLRGDLSVPGGERGRGVLLALFMTGSVFVGELLLLAAGVDIFGTRNLAPAWAGLPLLIAAFCVAAGSITGLVAVLVALAGFSYSSLWLADGSNSTIDYEGAARLIESREVPGGKVLDVAILSPAPQAPLDAYLDTDMETVRATVLEDRPDFINRMFDELDSEAVVDEAFEGQGPVEVVTVTDRGVPVQRDGPAGSRYRLLMDDVVVPVPAGWTMTAQKTFEGTIPLTVTRFERTGN